MATQSNCIKHDINHFRAFSEHYLQMRKCTMKSVIRHLEHGEMQVSTMQENTISHLSGVPLDSRAGRDFADGSDAKMATVCYRERGCRGNTIQEQMLQGIERQILKLVEPRKRKHQKVVSWFNTETCTFRPRAGNFRLIAPRTMWTYQPGTEMQVLESLRYDIENKTVTLCELVESAEHLRNPLSFGGAYLCYIHGGKTYSHEPVEDLHQLLESAEQARQKSSKKRQRTTLAQAVVKGVYNKKGGLLVQVYEPKQDRFFFFRIPRRAYAHISKNCGLRIWFNEDGSPKRDAGTQSDIWRYQVSSFEAMCKGTEGVKWLNK